eukprot:UN06294
MPKDIAINFHVIIPFSTFHDVFWGIESPRALVMNGGCTVKNWAYKQLYNFAMAFDSSSENWVKYYEVNGKLNDNKNDE